MIKKACNKGRNDNYIAFPTIFMPSKDALRSFRAFIKKPIPERTP